MNLDLLRTKLHAAIDETFATVVTEAAVTSEPPEPQAGPILPAFDYIWPAQEGSEHFTAARAYPITIGSSSRVVVVAWTERQAWGKLRRRAVVFDGSSGLADPRTWYPWTEFVETDDGRFAATIPNPGRPRAVLNERDPLPTRFATATVCRADQLFDSIQDGPSLRVVVSEEDESRMVQHGYWVAGLRGRI